MNLKSSYPLRTDYKKSQTICLEFSEQILKEIQFLTEKFCDGDIFEINFYKHLMKNGKRK